MSPSHAPLDPWDQPEAATSSHARRRPPAPSAVRDDWEDDDDDDNDDEINSAAAREQIDGFSSARQRPESPAQDVEENRRIWEAANTKVAAPMPTVLASRAASAIPPPAAAFQPTFRILKRPQSSSSSPRESSGTSPAPGESLQEREARYAAARERIFGGSDNNQDHNTLATDEGRRKDDGNKTKSPSPKLSGNTVKIVETPKSPEQQTQGKPG